MWLRLVKIYCSNGHYLTKGGGKSACTRTSRPTQKEFLQSRPPSRALLQGQWHFIVLDVGQDVLP